MLDPDSANTLTSGPNGLTVGLDLFWFIQTLLWFEQFLFLSLFFVKKVISELCQPGGKWGLNRARGKVSEQPPAQKETREGAPLCIPSYLPAMLGGGISPAPFPAVSAFCSSLHVPEASSSRCSLGHLAPTWGDKAGRSGSAAARGWAALSASAVAFPSSLFLSLLCIVTLFWPFWFVHLSWFLNAGYCAWEVQMTGYILHIPWLTPLPFPPSTWAPMFWISHMGENLVSLLHCMIYGNLQQNLINSLFVVPGCTIMISF